MICHGNRKIWHGRGTVRENVRLAERTYRLAVRVDASFPDSRAGQFVMLRLADRSDPLLGRPLALYRLTRSGDSALVEVVYLTVGKMTDRLAEVKPGDTLDLWAPLGNGFDPDDGRHTIMVAGGIGQTPFLMLAAKLSRRTLLYGARHAGRIACMDDFERLGVDVRVATDDGSRGYHGPVTDLIRSVHRGGESANIVCCGPQPMLRAAFGVAQDLGLPCQVSLETPMSCGLGICFGCVIPWKTDDGTWDYRRTCVDGPVFDAYRLRWD